MLKKKKKSKNHLLLKNMKIGKKLILTFLFVTLISSASGVIGFAIMTVMDSSYSGALVDYGFSQGDIGLFSAEFNNDRALVRDIVIETDGRSLQNTKDEISQSQARMDQYLAKIKPEMVTAKEKNYYNSIKSSLNDYLPIQAQVINFALAKKDGEAGQLLTQTCTPFADKVTTAISALVSEKTNVGTQVSAELNQKGTVAKITILCIIAFSIFLSILIAVLISRGISKPISGLVSVADRIAEGDLNVTVDVGSKDEIGQLSAAFARTGKALNSYISDIKSKLARVESGDLTAAGGVEYKGDFVQLAKSLEGIVLFMNRTISGIRQASQQVSSGSGQVSTGAQALAQGAAEQASSIEELSSSIAEITVQIQSSADQTERASESAENVNSSMQKCNRQMQGLVGAMSKIQDSSDQIGKIIKTIESIAFQTNILALNAAVEAAHAGDAGKGFAVVADEVRNLAGKSAAAAKDTALLIRNSIGEVQNGTKIADETAKSLLQIVEGAKTVSGAVVKISDSTQKQSDAIRRIKTGMDQISGVVQTNSATAQESAAASEELSSQARAMNALAGKFKLQKETAAS